MVHYNLARHCSQIQMSTGYKPKYHGAYIRSLESSVFLKLHHNMNKQHKNN